MRRHPDNRIPNHLFLLSPRHSSYICLIVDIWVYNLGTLSTIRQALDPIIKATLVVPGTVIGIHS